MLLRLAILLFSVTRLSSVSGAITSQPEIYSDFSKDQPHHEKQAFFSSGLESQFWSYYDNGVGKTNSPSFGSYERSNPVTWWDHMDSSPYRTVIQTPGTRGETKILNLSYRPRISHGPRRKRSHGQFAVQKLREFLDIPLYCWKVLINCKRFRNHVCCPVMPDFMKPKKEDRKNNQPDGDDKDTNDSGQTQRTAEVPPRIEEVFDLDFSFKNRSKRSPQHVVYKDPLFGIPVANPTPDMIGPVTAAPTSAAAIDRSDAPLEVTTCADIDCYWIPDHHCCQIDRFAPIEPYVQSSLSENWVSALFALFGNNPLVYVFAKKVFLAALFWIGLLIWNRFGQGLGVLPTYDSADTSKRDLRDPIDRMDIWELSEKVLTAMNGREWYGKLLDFQLDNAQNVNKLVCCFVQDDLVYDPIANALEDPVRKKESRSAKTKKKQMRCFRKGNAEKESTIQCISNLVYDIKMGSAQSKTTS